MKTILRMSAMLAMALGSFSLPAVGQRPSASGVAPAGAADAQRFDVAANFTYKIAKVSQTTTSFILPGASVDAAWHFSGKASGVSIVVDFGGESRSNIEPGVSLTQFSIVAGPRYTLCLNPRNAHAMSLFGQVMGGEVFASNSVFPAIPSANSNASSGVFQAGGGVNIRLTHLLSLRLVEADFLTTSLPNNVDNLQHDVRFSDGVVFRF